MRVHRLVLSKRAVTPIVAEVILVAICVVMCAVILFTAGAIAPGSYNSPQMDFSQVTKDTWGVKLTITDAVPNTEFIQFKFVAIPPGEEGGLSVIFDGNSVYHLNDTLILYLVDLGGDGYVSSGDYMMLTSMSGYEPGQWGFHLLYLPGNDVTASASLVIT